MAYFNATISADALNNLRQWGSATSALPPLKKNQGLFLYGAVVRIESWDASVEVSSNTIYKFRALLGKHTSDLPFSDDRLIVDFQPNEQWGSSYYAFQRSGTWRQDILRDKVIVDSNLTLLWEVKKASAGYKLNAYVRFYYDIVKVSKSEWLAAFGR